MGLLVTMRRWLFWESKFIELKKIRAGYFQGSEFSLREYFHSMFGRLLAI